MKNKRCKGISIWINIIFILSLLTTLIVSGCTSRIKKNMSNKDLQRAEIKETPKPIYVDNKRLLNLFDSGLESLKDDPRTALEIYKETARIASDRWEVNFNTAVSYMRLGDFRNAEDEFNRALKNKAPQSEIYSAVGTIYAIEGKNSKAIEAFESAFIYEKSPRTLINIANVYQTMGQSEKAIKYYRDAEAGDSANPILHYNLGVLLSKLGRFKEANEEYNKSLDYVKANVKATYSMAQTLLKNGKSEEAVNILKETAEKNPDVPDTYKYMGIIYEIYLDDMEKALINYTTYKTKKGNAGKEVDEWIDSLNTRLKSKG